MKTVPVQKKPRDAFKQAMRKKSNRDTYHRVYEQTGSAVEAMKAIGVQPVPMRF